MNRRTLLLLVTCGFAVLLVVLVWILAVGFPPERITLNDADVESVTAEVLPVDVMGTDHIPPFTIPQKYHSEILDALRPIVRIDSPSWGELPAVAKLSIRSRNGTQFEVLVPWSGQNALYYKLNGDWCGRDGPYEPVYDFVLDNGIRLGYADESLLLCHALRQIHEEVTTGEDNPKLADAFADLHRSAGKLPPRPN